MVRLQRAEGLGELLLAWSSGTDVTMITSSPCFQFAWKLIGACVVSAVKPAQSN
jgi:hypothetical protein